MRLLDRVPDEVKRTRWFQWLLLFAGPLVVSGAVWLANIASGSAFAEGCQVGGVLLDAAGHTGFLDALGRSVPVLDGLAAPTSACRSVPFSADLPNMVLSVSAGFACSVYVLFNLRLSYLRQDLEESGLVSTRSLDRSGVAAALAAYRRNPTRARVENIVLLVVSVVGSAGMYYWLYTQGPIFRDLAGSYTRMGSPGVTTELLRENWWANHTNHPQNTALGIAVGAIGLFFALKQRTTFVALGRAMVRLRRMPDPVEFVPRWLDRDYGWRPVNGLVTLGYVAILTFLAAFTAALYALRSDEPGLSQVLSILLALIALFAAITNGIFFASLIVTIRRVFADSVARERARILGALRGVALAGGRRRMRAVDRLALLTEGANLADVPDYPISRPWLRLLTVAPAFAGAVWTFSNEVGRAFGI